MFINELLYWLVMDFIKDRTVVIPSPLEAELRAYVAISGERHGYLLARKDDLRNRYLCDALCVGGVVSSHNVAEWMTTRFKVLGFLVKHREYENIAVHVQHRAVDRNDLSLYHGEMMKHSGFVALVYKSGIDGIIKRNIVKPHSNGAVHVEIVAPDGDFDKRKRDISRSLG